MRARRAGQSGGWTRAWATVGMATVAVLSTVGGMLATSAVSATPAGADASPVTCVGSSLTSILNTGTGNIWIEAKLGAGQALCSGTYELVMQGDGNLVLYDESQSTPIWASGTAGQNATEAVLAGESLSVGSWNTPGNAFVMPPSTTLQLGSNGNLSITTSAGTLIWQTGTDGSNFAQILESGQSMSSPNGQYRLDMQSDGNLVLTYVTTGSVLWASNTSGNSGAGTVMQDDGNLVVYSVQHTALYASGSVATNPTLVVQDDGNVVVYGMNQGTQFAAWSTDTAGDRGTTLGAGQTLQPGQYFQNGQYTLRLSTAGVLALYSTQPYVCPLWTAPTIAGGSSYSAAPQSGSYFVVDKTGGLDLDSPGTTSVWWTASQTSTWTGPSSTPSDDHLTLGSDGNLVLYSATDQVVWNSDTERLRGSILCTGTDLDQGQYLVPWTSGSSAGPVLNGSGKNSLVMQGTCNLVLYYNNAAVWNSNTATARAGTKNGPLPDATKSVYTGCYATMQADGNLVVYAPDYPGGQRVLWQSGTTQSSQLPFNLGAIGPYLTIPIVGGTTQAPFVTTAHGTTLGDPLPPSKSKVLQILSDVFDALGLVLTFVAGPLGDVFQISDAASNILGGIGVDVDEGATAVAGASAARSNAVVGQISVATTVLGSCSAASPATASQGTLITSGGCLLSPNGQYELLMQQDGNLVLYYQDQGDPIWDSNTANNPGAFLRIQSNGFTAVLNSTNTTTLFVVPKSVVTANPTLTLSNNGNLVLYGNNSTPSTTVGSYAVWQTATANLRGDTLPAGSALLPGQYLSSSNGTYKLSMGTNGLLELSYATPGTPSYFCPMWSRPYSTTLITDLKAGNPESYSPSLSAGSSLVMQGDGNLVVDSASGALSGYPIDISGTEPNLGNNPGAYLVLQTDGNLVVYSSTGSVLWASGTNDDRGPALCTGASLTPGQYLTEVGSTNKATQNILTFTSTCQLVYTSTYAGTVDTEWSTSDGVAAGQDPNCSATMQGDGNLVVYSSDSPTRTALWASKTHQTSLPPNLVQNLGPFSLVNAGYVPDGSGEPGAQVLTDSGVVLWQDPTDPNPNAAADGSTAVSAVQTLVGFLTLLLPLLL